MAIEALKVGKNFYNLETMKIKESIGRFKYIKETAAKQEYQTLLTEMEKEFISLERE